MRPSSPDSGQALRGVRLSSFPMADPGFNIEEGQKAHVPEPYRGSLTESLVDGVAVEKSPAHQLAIEQPLANLGCLRFDYARRKASGASLLPAIKDQWREILLERVSHDRSVDTTFELAPGWYCQGELNHGLAGKWVDYGKIIGSKIPFDVVLHAQEKSDMAFLAKRRAWWTA